MHKWFAADDAKKIIPQLPQSSIDEEITSRIKMFGLDSKEDLRHRLKVQGVTIGLSHGKDREYLNRPLPRVMTEKVENYLISYCLNHNINPKEFICLSGDQHNWSDTFSQNLRYIKCPSLFGSSEHSEMNYGRSIIGFVTAEFKPGATIKNGVIIKPELL